MNQLNITVTEAAKARFAKIADGKIVRLTTPKAGCSGLKYKVELIDAPEVTDDVIDVGSAQLAIARKDSLHLFGITIDYIETDLSQEFTFDNPNAKGHCGCGESFAV